MSICRKALHIKEKLCSPTTRVVPLKVSYGSNTLTISHPGLKNMAADRSDYWPAGAFWKYPGYTEIQFPDLTGFLPVTCCLSVVLVTILQSDTVVGFHINNKTDWKHFTFTPYMRNQHFLHHFYARTSWPWPAPSPTLWGVWAPSPWSCRAGSETTGLWPPRAFCSL